MLLRPLRLLQLPGVRGNAGLSPAAGESRKIWILGIPTELLTYSCTVLTVRGSVPGTIRGSLKARPGNYCF